jgi:hypothetical protein
VLISGYLVDTFNILDSFGSLEENTYLTDSIQISDVLAPGTIITLVDNTMVLQDYLSVAWTPAPIVDSINVSDEITYSFTSYLADSFNASSRFGSIDQTTNLRSTVRLSDLQNVVVIALLTDTFQISDLQELTTIANLTSNFTIGSEEINSAIANSTISSTFQIGDSQALGLAEYLTSTGLFSTSLEDLRTQIELLTDSITLTDVQVLSATVREELQSVIQISDTQSFAGSVYNVVVISTLEVGDIIWSPDFGSIAWVMNTEGLSIAPYSNFGFHSLAAHANKVFAVSPAGIYELTGETDDGRKIEAYVKGGFNDFGSPQRKRASDLYLSYTGGRLQAAIETYDGPKTVYNYPIEEREASAPRNNRMKVGRGLVSRYWRTEVRNLTGATFKVYEIGLNTVTSKRRL